MKDEQGFFGKYWKILLLLIVLTTMVSYHFIKLDIVNSSNDKKIHEIEADYELTLDSNFSAIMEVLSWAVNSELVRKNNENANIYLKNFVKSEFLHVLQADLIDPSSGNIDFSTNSAFINTQIKLTEYNKVKKMDDGFYYIPVTGDNYVISILRVKFE